MKPGLFAAAFLAAVFTISAVAAQQDFTVINRTGFVIVALNVSPSSETRWGPDILGREVLADGETAQVSFDRTEGVCEWDIRVTYSDGDTGDWRQVNLCEIGEVTLSGQ